MYTERTQYTRTRVELQTKRATIDAIWCIGSFILLFFVWHSCTGVWECICVFSFVAFFPLWTYFFLSRIYCPNGVNVQQPRSAQKMFYTHSSQPFSEVKITNSNGCEKVVLCVLSLFVCGILHVKRFSLLFF